MRWAGVSLVSHRSTSARHRAEVVSRHSTLTRSVDVWDDDQHRRDGRSPAYLPGLQTPAMRGVPPSLNNVATAVVVIGIVVSDVRIVVSVVVRVAIRSVAVVVVPVVV